VWLGGRSLRIVLHNTWQELSNYSSSTSTNVLCHNDSPINS